MSATTALRSLRRFAREAVVPACDLCGAPIADDHEHLLAADDRGLACACPPCAVLFDASKESAGRFTRIATRVERLADATIDDDAWRGLRIPVALAAIVGRRAGRLALYPGPAGLVESALDEATWQSVVAASPTLSRVEPRVEALLADRTRARPDYFRVSIDVCFALAGLMRTRPPAVGGVAPTLRAFLDELEAGRVPSSVVEHAR